MWRLMGCGGCAHDGALDNARGERGAGAGGRMWRWLKRAESGAEVTVRGSNVGAGRGGDLGKTAAALTQAEQRAYTDRSGSQGPFVKITHEGGRWQGGHCCRAPSLA